MIKMNAAYSALQMCGVYGGLLSVVDSPVTITRKLIGNHEALKRLDKFDFEKYEAFKNNFRKLGRASRPMNQGLEENMAWIQVQAELHTGKERDFAKLLESDDLKKAANFLKQFRVRRTFKEKVTFKNRYKTVNFSKPASQHEIDTFTNKLIFAFDNPELKTRNILFGKKNEILEKNLQSYVDSKLLADGMAKTFKEVGGYLRFNRRDQFNEWLRIKTKSPVVQAVMTAAFNVQLLISHVKLIGYLPKYNIKEIPQDLLDEAFLYGVHHADEGGREVIDRIVDHIKLPYERADVYSAVRTSILKAMRLAGTGIGVCEMIKLHEAQKKMLEEKNKAADELQKQIDVTNDQLKKELDKQKNTSLSDELLEKWVEQKEAETGQPVDRNGAEYLAEKKTLEDLVGVLDDNMMDTVKTMDHCFE